MNIEQMVAELRRERDRITQAIAAIEALAGSGAPLPGPSRTGAAVPRGGARISAAGRRRIAEAARRRWANIKAAKAGKPAKAAPAAPGRRMGAAARKRLSELAKARWAKRKKEGKTRL